MAIGLQYGSGSSKQRSEVWKEERISTSSILWMTCLRHCRCLENLIGLSTEALCFNLVFVNTLSFIWNEVARLYFVIILHSEFGACVYGFTWKAILRRGSIRY